MICRYLHMVSGVILFLYVIFNAIFFFLLFRGENAFDAIFQFIHSPFALISVALLLLVTFFHTLNGIRILFINSGLWIEDQKDIAYTVFVLVLILFVIHFIPLLEQVIGRALF